MIFELRGIAQNLAMSLGPVRRAASAHHRTGMNGDAAMVDEQVQFYADRGALEGKVVLELGPGQTPQVLARARALGALRCVGVDVERYVEAEEAARLGIEIVVYDGGVLPFEDGTFDLVWSSDVLEHVRRPELTLRETARVLRTGGLAIHRIDLRDHYFLDREEAWLRCLRYSDPMWRAIAWNRSSYVNRLRRSDWHGLFADVGLVLEREEAGRSEVLRAAALRGELPASRPYLSVDDAETYRLDVVLRKRSHGES